MANKNFPSDLENSEKITPEEDAESVSVYEEIDTNKAQRSSNSAIIVLIIILIAAIIALVVLGIIYFTNYKPKDDVIPVSDNVSTVVSEISVTDVVNTTEATVTTTEKTTTTAASTTTAVEKYADVSSYIGFWHKESIGEERELTISDVNGRNITFSLWYYRIDSIENVSAVLENNTAYFDTGDVKGHLNFENNIITVVITNSSRAYMPPERMTFDGRHDHSWEYEGFDTAAAFEPYVIQVTNPYLLIYDAPSYYANVVGEITDKSRYTIVEEYNGDFDTWGKLKSGLGWINLYDATIADDYTYDGGIGDDGRGYDEFT